MFLIRIKAKYMVAIYILIDIAVLLTEAGKFNALLELSGALCGFLLLRYMPRRGLSLRRSPSATIGLRNDYYRSKRRRAARKFEVYMGKQGRKVHFDKDGKLCRPRRSPHPWSQRPERPPLDELAHRPPHAYASNSRNPCLNEWNRILVTMMNRRTRTFLFAPLLATVLAATFAPAALLAAPPAAPPAGQPRGPVQRVVLGKVEDKSGAPLKGAIVYLQDSRTSAVKSAISGDDGSYRFVQLSQNTDYTLWAKIDDRKSPNKSISSFDTKNEFNITLKIDK